MCVDFADWRSVVYCILLPLLYVSAIMYQLAVRHTCNLLRLVITVWLYHPNLRGYVSATVCVCLVIELTQLSPQPAKFCGHEVQSMWMFSMSQLAQQAGVFFCTHAKVRSQASHPCFLSFRLAKRAGSDGWTNSTVSQVERLTGQAGAVSPILEVIAVEQ